MSKPQVFSASEIIGKSLYAKQRANVRSNPSTNSTLLRTLKKGESTLPVYSYVNAADGLWWQLDDNSFVKHNPKVWSKDKLKEQGAKPEEEKIKEKEEQEKTYLQKIGDSISNPFSGGTSIVNKVLIFGVVILGVYLIVTKVILKDE